MQNIVVSILLLGLLGGVTSCSKDLMIRPHGVYATIDTQPTTDIIHSLQSPKPEDRAEAMQKIVEHPGDYAPPALYLLSSVYWQENKKNDAMFWFYAGQLRGTIDANICADKTAGSAIAALNEKFGPEINKYAFTDIPRLTNTVEAVITWEVKTPCNYDRRWISLDGLSAFSTDANHPLSAPKEQWETIRKNTRDNYRSSFYEMLKTLPK